MEHRFRVSIKVDIILGQQAQLGSEVWHCKLSEQNRPLGQQIGNRNPVYV